MLNSLVRTIVPLFVGLILSLALKLGLDIDSDALTDLITLLVSAGYYAAVRWAERRNPDIGWLLGRKGAPTYEDAETP